MFEPQRFVHRPDDGRAVRGFFGGGLTWIEIPRNDEAFRAFLGEVLTVLEAPQPPASSRDCVYCAYRTAARETGW